MKAFARACVAAAVIGASAQALSQTAGFDAAPALVDSTGKVAGIAFGDGIVLVRIAAEVRAPAVIRPIYDEDGRTASGLATWSGGGSVLFTSADCSTGAHVYTLTHPGMRAASQVETPQGTMLYAGAIGPPISVDVRSVLYPTGCSALRIRQNGLVPVVASVNLSASFPPPLSLQ